MSMLKGYKTYIFAGLLAVYAIAGFLTGHMDANTALGILFGSGGLASLRNAIPALN